MCGANDTGLVSVVDTKLSSKPTIITHIENGIGKSPKSIVLNKKGDLLYTANYCNKNVTITKLPWIK